MRYRQTVLLSLARVGLPTRPPGLGPSVLWCLEARAKVGTEQNYETKLLAVGRGELRRSQTADALGKVTMGRC